MIPWLLVLLAPTASAPTAWGGAQAAAAEDREAVLVAELQRLADAADPARIVELAELATPDALDGLIRTYERMESVYMRREVLEAVARFTRIGECAETACAALLDVAVSSPSPVLRARAVRHLGEAPGAAEHLFELFARSDVPEAERLAALGHLPLASDEGVRDRLEGLLEEGTDEPGCRRGEGLAPGLRASAFRLLAPHLSSHRLEQSLEDPSWEVRAAALRELGARGDRHLGSRAEELYRNAAAPAGVRLEAARLWLSARRPKVATRLLDDALRADATFELATGLAEIVSGVRTPPVRRALLQELRNADEEERFLLLRAARGVEDEELTEVLLEALGAGEPWAAREAAQQLAARGEAKAIPRLEEVLAKPGAVTVRVAALEALDRLRRGEPAWERRLRELVRHRVLELRNASVELLGERRDEPSRAALLAALDHPLWSTRLTAVRALERSAFPEAVGALCRRIGEEDGRVLHEIAAVLWRLTGMPLGTRAASWEDWWRDVGADFRVISPEELARREGEAEERRLRQVTSAGHGRSWSGRHHDGDVLGSRILSERVSFVLDVSVSMEDRAPDPLHPGEEATLFELARRELDALLERLAPDARVQLVYFDGEVRTWKPGPVAASRENVEDLRAFLEELDLGARTDLYGAVRTALDDRETDTLFLLSDGRLASMPVASPRAVLQLVGAPPMSDPGRVRADLKARNEHRHVVLHCFALGGESELLRRLARDSGGAYASIP